ncbi:MAG: sugar phosphate isomerase/epimerase [Candidatus Poribacteria bacterium]|nr:sugar phosphate isomerase/epimerase [Candidatus Poribacteria bacterium]
MFHYSYIIIDFSEIEHLQATFALLKDCGYAGVELNLTTDVLNRLDEIESTVAADGLVVPALLTGAAYEEGLCLSSPDSKIRELTVERLKSYLDVASRFDAILVVGLLQGLRSDEADPVAANQRIAACLREVGLFALDAGVEFVIEPVNHLQVGFNNSLAEVQRLIAEIDVPVFKPMVDTIHMNIEETSLTEPVYRCGESLGHVHLCESNAGLFGAGRIDFKSVLDALNSIGYEGFASVKVYRNANLEEGIRSSIEFLRAVS